MSNIRAIRHVDRIINVNQGGGSKKQGIASSTNLNTTAHVAFRNRNVVCPCNRDVIFCMNQLGGVGAGGVPGRSYMFASSADGVHRPFYCGYKFALPLRKIKATDKLYLATKGNDKVIITEEQKVNYESNGWSVSIRWFYYKNR
jgi:hypothetical protein